MKANRNKYQKSALRIIEEAVHILRRAPVWLLSVYYLGTVPFVLGLLYFWADMSRSPKASHHSAAAALGLAVLFVWMKVWQTIFARRVRTRISGEQPSGWSPGQIVSISATQCLIQATRFIVLPVAAFLAVPFGYCYAFFQNATVYADWGHPDVKPTCKWAWKQAKMWPRQNLLIIGIFWLFGLVILLNVSITTIIIPQLIKSLFGVETVFTLGGLAVLVNSTFWMAMMAITYLLLDPFIKAAYVMRCFYGTALGSGEDLKTELNRFLNSGAKIIAGLLVFVICAAPFGLRAASNESVAPEQLDQSIEEVMSRPEFSWRMPRVSTDQKEPDSMGPLEAAMKWLVDMIAKILKKIGEWITKFFEWLESLLPQREGKPAAADKNWKTPVRIVLLLLLILLLAVMIFIFMRVWQRRLTKPAEAISTPAEPVPDLTDESIKADDLSIKRWLSLATELADKGDLRLAMRALYLATLAHLADREMITIESYKSNREYENELRRRAHEHRELISIFSSSRNVFERIWYGMHPVVRSEFDSFSQNQKRMIAFADQ